MSISEIQVGSLIRVKVGRNIILAKVLEILDGAVRVCSLANNKEFNVPESRVELDGDAEDEAAEFTPSGEDQEDEYVINPAHESDKPKKHMSLLSAAVIVLKDAGPEHPMNCKEILEAILARQLWTPTDCKTTEQTLYGSIFREINTKDHPRIVKSDIKGKFRIAE